MGENKRKARVATYVGKSVHKSILKSFEEESKQISQDRFNTLYGMYNLIQPLYDPTLMVDYLDKDATHFSCCKQKAQDVAGSGFELEKTSDKATDLGRERIEELLIYSFTDYSLNELIYKVMLDFEAVGWGCIEVVREDYDMNKPIVRLSYASAESIRVSFKGNELTRFQQLKGTKRIWFKKIGYPYDIHITTGEEFPLNSLPPEERANELHWIVNASPVDTVYGESDIVPAMQALAGNYLTSNYNLGFFENNMVPPYAVTITGNFDESVAVDDAGNTIEDVIVNKLGEVAENPQAAMVITLPSAEDSQEAPQINFEKLIDDVTDQSFSEYRKDNRDEILMAHRVPAYRVAVTETGSLGGNVAEETTEIYKVSVIDPRQDRIEWFINRWVIPSLDVKGWKFKLKDIDTGNEEAEFKQAMELFKAGAITPNELRARFGDKFNLDIEETNELMDTTYVNNEPLIDPGQDISTDIITKLRRFIKSIFTGGN